MKYKALKSAAHNFSHSFVSYMNYVDGAYIVEDLLQLARKAEGERISIQWIPDTASEQRFPRRVQKSIASYKEWLPKHILNSGAEIDRIQEFRTEIFLKPNKQIAVQAFLIDDRGKKYVCDVSLAS